VKTVTSATERRALLTIGVIVLLDAVLVTLFFTAVVH